MTGAAESALTDVDLLTDPGVYALYSARRTVYYVDAREVDAPRLFRAYGGPPSDPYSDLDDRWLHLLLVTSWPSGRDERGVPYVREEQVNWDDYVDWRLRVGRVHRLRFLPRRSAQLPLWWTQGLLTGIGLATEWPEP
ncbi:hypothetical protein [Demequina sp.]|uniref:hypothetical protein n=1 Tax=Demequina sp. TaxID=2050685 RepID=UPI003D0F3438